MAGDKFLGGDLKPHFTSTVGAIRLVIIIQVDKAVLIPIRENIVPIPMWRFINGKFTCNPLYLLTITNHLSYKFFQISNSNSSKILADHLAYEWTANVFFQLMKSFHSDHLHAMFFFFFVSEGALKPVILDCAFRSFK